MRSPRYLLILALAASLVLAGTGCPLSDDDTGQPETGWGSAAIDVDFTLLSSAGFNVSQISVSLESESGLQVERDLSVISNPFFAAIPSLSAGKWSITTNLYDSETLIGTGTGEISISEDKATVVSLNISVSGTGGNPVPAVINKAVFETDHIYIEWDLAPGASGYNILRSTSEDGEFVKINPEMVTASYYRDTAWDTDTFYFYKIESLAGTLAIVTDTPTEGVQTPPEKGNIEFIIY